STASTKEAGLSPAYEFEAGEGEGEGEEYGEEEDAEAPPRWPVLTWLLVIATWVMFLQRWLPLWPALTQPCSQGPWEWGLRLAAVCLVMPDTPQLVAAHSVEAATGSLVAGAGAVADVLRGALLHGGLLQTWLFSWGMLAVGEQLEVQDGHLTLLLLLLGAGLGAAMAQNLALGPGAAVARLTGPAVVAGLYVALAVCTALPMYSIVFKPSSSDPQYSTDQGTASSQGAPQAAGEVRGSQQGQLQPGVPSQAPGPAPGPSPMAEPGQVSSRRRSFRGSKLGRSAAQVSASTNAADAAATSGGQGGSGGGEGGSSGVDAVQRLAGGWREHPDAPRPLMDSRLVSAGGWDQEEDSLVRAAEEAWGRVAELPLGHALWLVALVVGLYMPGLGIR
ncbi:hypothetical protein QJQ45_022485, partial [Haematococcus lacustris]